VNDLFLSLWFDRRRPENPKGYLFKSVKNASLNFITKQKRNPISYLEESELTVFSDLTVPVVIEDSKSDKLEFLQKIIESLPERRQLVFKLYRFEGFSYAEIAELMQISVRTVEDHLSKSMQFIHSKAKQLIDLDLTEA
jgi:RNA polymerase sigma factor (sigma-70 family)